MPLYEFKCKTCGKIKDRIRGMEDNKQEFCDNCGGIMEKLISIGGFILKGDGWAKDGYAKK